MAMASLRASGITMSRGTRVLFDGLDLTLAPDEIVGLLGPNGSGKTTLLRILAGQAEPDGGEVRLTPPEAVVGFLPQETPFLGGESVEAFLERLTGVAAAGAALDAAAQGLASGATGAEDAYSLALQQWLSLGAPDFEERIGRAMADVGLAVERHRAMAALSGGQAARASLAALLVSRFDVYLLDEPTNNLDLDGLALLEGFVQGLRAPVLLVSHDREFLSRTVDRILEIDPAHERVAAYAGGYEAWLRERQRSYDQAQERYDEYQRNRDALAARARRARATASRGEAHAKRAYAKGTVDKLNRNAMIEGAQSGGSSARRLERQLQRMEEVTEPRKQWQLRMSVGAAPVSGEVVCTLRDAVVRRGSFALGPVSLTVARGDRVGIVGPNGSGKSTLLGMLLGRIEPDSGSARTGAGLRVGEIDQARSLLAGPASVLAVLRLELPDLRPVEVRTLAAKFGIAGNDVQRSGSSLSPGERTRAALALLQGRGVNLLALDEPTNHLDLPAVEQLEQAVAAYDGTLLLVSHDRRLLQSVALTRTFELLGGTVTEARRSSASSLESAGGCAEPAGRVTDDAPGLNSAGGIACAGSNSVSRLPPVPTPMPTHHAWQPD
jgi:ATPase subunit of ABC transporter with duplicated ATPase domains